MENKNQPAFPKAKQILGSGEDYQEIPGASGLTIRQYAAIKAMQGILSNSLYMESVSINKNGRDFTKALTEDAIKYADNLLKQLEQ